MLIPPAFTLNLEHWSPEALTRLWFVFGFFPCFQHHQDSCDIASFPFVLSSYLVDINTDVVTCKYKVGITLYETEAGVFSCLSVICWDFLSPASVFAPNCCFLISSLLMSQLNVEGCKDKGERSEDFCKIETFLSEVANRL